MKMRDDTCYFFISYLSALDHEQKRKRESECCVLHQP
jgi:hypothetical protein